LLLSRSHGKINAAYPSYLQILKAKSHWALLLMSLVPPWTKKLTCRLGMSIFLLGQLK